MIDEDENLRFRVTWQRRWDHKHWWHKPAHVCRRWRNLILGSASFLGLYLVCTLGTPVADILANSPPLPLVIDYIDGSHHYDLDGRPNGPGITAEDKEGIFLALEQPNRIRYIRVGLSFQYLQKFFMAIDHELPILEYLVMLRMSRDHDATFVFPETIQAPRLRHIVLHSIAPPIGSRLFTTAVGLVKLCLFMGGNENYNPIYDSSTFINPNILLQWISPLSQLETLEIITFPNPDVETQLSHTPIISHATLPNLRLLSFRGVCAYLEVLIHQITTPRLERLRVIFFDQDSYSIPCLVRFMNTTENKRLWFDSAKFVFSGDGVRLVTYPHEENRRCSLSISVDCWKIHGHNSPIVQIVDALGQVFSAVENLILDYMEDSRSSEELFGPEVGPTEWRNLFRPFSNVKNFRVNDGLVEGFSCYLRSDDHGGLPLELLSELQELTYSGCSNPVDAFTSFIDAHQNAGHRVSFKLVRLSPNTSP
jgi:hypothetical protein